MRYDINLTIKALMSNARDRDSMVSPHGERVTNFAKLGQIVYIKGHKYRVEEAQRNGSCFGCDFLEEGVCQKTIYNKATTCSGYTRYDGQWVIFKRIQPK